MPNPKLPDNAVFVGDVYFADSRAVDGDTVLRTGKVFELGSWSDKAFALNDAEADEACANFAPVDNDLEHRKSILDGKLGQLESVRRVGDTLFGDVRIPKWLDIAIGPDPLGISLAWNSAKQIVGNALTFNPRITDACVTAAFSCDAGHSALEAFAFFSEFAGRRNSASDLTDIQAVHDLTVKLGAKCLDPDPDPVTTYTKETRPLMKIKDLLAVFGIAGTPDLEAEITQVAAPAVIPAAAPANPAPAAIAAFTAENAALLGEIRATREANTMIAAKAFCAELRAEQKIVPAQESAIIAAFCQNAKDDAKGQPGYMEGLACFTSEGGLYEGPRLKTLRDQYAVAPKLGFTEEQLGATEKSILFTDGSQTELTPAALAGYLKASSLGKAALASMKETK